MESEVPVSQGRLEHGGGWMGAPARPAYLTEKVTVMWVGSRARLPGLAFHIPALSPWMGQLASTPREHSAGGSTHSAGGSTTVSVIFLGCRSSLIYSSVKQLSE